MSDPSLGTAFLLSFFAGVLGIDKFYVGATGLGILQLILTLTLIGLIISVPWALISSLVLAIAILSGGIPSLYPDVKWAPLTDYDRYCVYAIIVLLLISAVAKQMNPKKECFEEEDDKKRKAE